MKCYEIAFHLLENKLRMIPVYLDCFFSFL